MQYSAKIRKTPLDEGIAFLLAGELAKLPSEGAPYPIMVYAAMLPWQFFANSLAEASNSLIDNANMLTKIIGDFKKRFAVSK